MDPALLTALIAAGTGAVSAFIAYWWGYSNAHTEGRIQILRLRAQIHEQHAIAVDLADALYRMRHPQRPLTPNERATFNDIADRLRRESA
jgi:hypothetical protein